MHGRLKVKTTAQQQEEKRLEREKKVEIYTSVMKQIFEKRCNEEDMDTNLKLTQQVLSGNPDIYTLWNIRKEIFIKKIENEDENVEQLLLDELDFVQSCLRGNPKSYGIWNQRRFVMLHMKEPQWIRELQLCNLFLQYDERNFHCWDYRRFVVRQSNISNEEELEYTTEKIKENFSNYSAWHNRTKLLAQAYPDAVDKSKVDEKELLKEFDFVQNAFFTDPNDQSAWFYQRWLLGRKNTKPLLLSLSHILNPQRLIVSFSQSVHKKDLVDSCTDGNGSSLPLEWTELVNKQTKYSKTWVSLLPDQATNTNLRISFEKITHSAQWYTVSTSEKSHLSWNRELKNDGNSRLFSDVHTTTKTSVLEDELAACRMLLDEEPDNKWTMATIVYLMKALDGLKYAEEIEQLISKLIKIDPMRRGYYKDLRSKYTIENKLQKISDNEESIKEFDLSNQSITSLAHLEYLTTCQKLNLKNNKLKDTGFLKNLPCLLEVDLTGIENLDGVR